MNKDYALIVGINDYTPPQKYGLRKLCGAINDANCFEKWIISKSGGNVPNANCHKIISGPNPLRPVQFEIDDAFLNIESDIKKKGGVANRLYFYFAGHGLGAYSNTQDTSLCLANWSEQRRRSALSSEAYKETIKQYGYFEEIIFIADCCRNTKINIKGKEPTFAPVAPGNNAGKTKLFVGYATQYQDQSYEIEVGEIETRGVFTKVLIEGLSGAAECNGIITADSLRDYLVLYTPIEAQKNGYKQKPEIIHSFGSNIPLVKLLNDKDDKVVYHITFNQDRISIIELIDNSGVINKYDASVQKKVKTSLKKGLYLLRDTMSDEKYSIQVKPSKAEIYVTF